MPSPVPGAYAPVAAADHAAYRSRRALRVPSAHARRLPEGRLPAAPSLASCGYRLERRGNQRVPRPQPVVL
jgi:hypothetical protein